MINTLSAQTADPIDSFIVMIRKIVSGKTTPKSGHSGRMYHNVKQVVPDANNPVGENIFSGI